MGIELSWKVTSNSQNRLFLLDGRPRPRVLDLQSHQKVQNKHVYDGGLYSCLVGKGAGQ